MTLLLGDCIERMGELPTGSVAAVVTDPPYGLGFMGKTWDSPGGTGDHPMRRNDALNTVNTGVTRQGGRQRTCEDFTKRQLRDARSYQEWCETWSRECLRVLQPGGFILAFGGTRTYHRLTTGVEEAGFEIRDTMAWLYGQGYPKHPTLLKPALELLAVARKTGQGSLNPKACKIAWLSEADERASKDRNRHADYGSGPRENTIYGTDSRTRAEQGNYDPEGRWPANVILDEVAAEMLDEQSGQSQSRVGKPRGSAKPGEGWGMTSTGSEYDDIGGASRFFYTAKATTAERNEGLAVPSLLTPHGAPEKNDHPTVKPIALMRWLVRLATPTGGTVLDPFLGSGTTAIAAALEGFPYIGIESDEHYMRIAEARISHRLTSPVEAVA